MYVCGICNQDVDYLGAPHNCAVDKDLTPKGLREGIGGVKYYCKDCGEKLPYDSAMCPAECFARVDVEEVSAYDYKYAEAPAPPFAAAPPNVLGLPQTPASAVDATLQQRGNRYGEYKDHARITWNIKRAMEDSPNWPSLEDYQKEALCMVAHKVARILNGDPNYADNWHDIQGFCKLVEDRLPSATKPMTNAEIAEMLKRTPGTVNILNTIHG
jgi:hypothetical protein